MKTQALGWTGERLPVIGQGTWQMERDDPKSAVAALQKGLDLGLTHIDTAELYGSGTVETLVAQAIAGRRDEVFLASKVLPSNASYEGTIAACEGSLGRLKTDRIDLYMLHWPGSHPLGDTVRAFEELVKRGAIRYWGVSNFDTGELDRLLAVAGPDRIACNQVLYHIEERSIEHRVLPWCEKHRVALVGYSPFGSGRFQSPASPRGKKLEAIGKKLGLTMRQLALAFLTRTEGVFAIPKASNARHVEDNARAGDVALPPDVVKEIEAVFPIGRDRDGVPTI